MTSLNNNKKITKNIYTMTYHIILKIGGLCLKGGSLIATSMVFEESPDPTWYHQLYTLLPCLL